MQALDDACRMKSIELRKSDSLGLSSLTFGPDQIKKAIKRSQSNAIRIIKYPTPQKSSQDRSPLSRNIFNSSPSDREKKRMARLGKSERIAAEFATLKLSPMNSEREGAIISVPDTRPDR